MASMESAVWVAEFADGTTMELAVASDEGSGYEEFLHLLLLEAASDGAGPVQKIYARI